MTFAVSEAQRGRLQSRQRRQIHDLSVQSFQRRAESGDLLVGGVSLGTEAGKLHLHLVGLHKRPLWVGLSLDAVHGVAGQGGGGRGETGDFGAEAERLGVHGVPCPHQSLHFLGVLRFDFVASTIEAHPHAHRQPSIVQF
jgi:hypothetical protein